MQIAATPVLQLLVDQKLRVPQSFLPPYAVDREKRYLSDSVRMFESIDCKAFSQGIAIQICRPSPVF